MNFCHAQEEARTHAWAPEKTYHTQGRVSAFAGLGDAEAPRSMFSINHRGVVTMSTVRFSKGLML